MRITYDDEADALYVCLREGVSVWRSIVVDDDRVVDVDGLGEAVGIEVLGASQGIHLTDLVEKFRLHSYLGHIRGLEQTKFEFEPKKEFA
ncbi:MAG: DUF2283 domain-containing protein [Actinomycetota bacterium]|nr:DUF2283 domain-containing protein [Actinomycetota bacterium]